jgi:peptide/nickel transport system substrate-binding protein
MYWMRKSVFLGFGLLFVVVVFLTGCGGALGDGAGAGGGAVGKDTVVVEIPSDPAGLVGGFNANTVINMLSDQVLDTLIRQNGDGSFEPALAAGWEIVDGKDYVFELRQGVKFHNGDTLIPEDVVFTFQRIIEDGFAATLTSNIEAVEKVDGAHVKVVFKTPYGPALTVLSKASCGIFSKAAYEAAGRDAFLRAPVGTGPYKFVSWKSGDSIVYEAFGDHWDGAPVIKNIIFRVFLDASVAAISLENGEIDVLTSPLQTDRDTLMNSSNVAYEETPSNMVTWAFFNCGAGRFTDQRLREAFSYAIDREAVLMGAIEGAGVRVNSMFPNHMPLHDDSYQARQYDKDKAVALLAECGYGPGNPFVINVRTSQDPRYTKPFEVMQAQLAEVNVNMTVEKMESSAWFMDVLQARDYEFNLLPTTIAYLDCDERYALFHSGEPQNNFGVADPELDAAFEINRVSTDETERRQASSDIIRIMDEKAYIIPLYGSMRGIAYRSGLQGAVPSPGYTYRIKDWSWS